MKLSIIVQATFALLSTSTANACAFFQTFDWSELPEDVKAAAMDLDYDNSTWNLWGTNPIEFVSFEDLVGEGDVLTFDTPIGQFTKKADFDYFEPLATLDLYNPDFEFPGVCWDMFVNHYDGYTWDELAEMMTPFGDNVEDLVTTLGWTIDQWDSTEGTVPESECTKWVDLTPEERWALRKLGWFALSWFETECDPRCPKSEACPNN